MSHLSREAILTVLSRSIAELEHVVTVSDVIEHKSLEMRFDMLAMSDAMRGDLINPDAAQACSTVDTNCDELVPTATGCTWGTTCLDVLQEFPEWAGTDRNFLLDPEGNGSPVQYFCDMTSTGGRPGAGWTRILSQNFTDGLVGGWQWDPTSGATTSASCRRSSSSTPSCRSAC